MLCYLQRSSNYLPREAIAEGILDSDPQAHSTVNSNSNATPTSTLKVSITPRSTASTGTPVILLGVQPCPGDTGKPVSAMTADLFREFKWAASAGKCGTSTLETQLHDGRRRTGRELAQLVSQFIDHPAQRRWGA